jgi:hypothetical protein
MVTVQSGFRTSDLCPTRYMAQHATWYQDNLFAVRHGARTVYSL